MHTLRIRSGPARLRRIVLDLLHTRMHAFRHGRRLRQRIRKPSPLTVGCGTTHRSTVPRRRQRRVVPRIRDAKVQRFSDLGNRIPAGRALNCGSKPACDRESAFPARNVEQPFHGIVNRPGKRNTAGIRQRLERVRLAGGNARMHPDPPLPDDHRYLHAASVREANRDGRARHRSQN